MDSDQSGKSQRKADLSDRITQHRATFAVLEWKAIRRVYTAYRTNLSELLGVITAPTLSPQLALELLHIDGGEDKRSRYFDELFRYLHNYLSSRHALIDHTRIFSRLYDGTEFESEYSKRVNEIGNMGVTRFLQELRNFLIHHAIPPLYIGTSWKQGVPPVFRVTLSSEDLLCQHRWTNALARSYIQSKDSIVLIDAVEEYNAHITTLYDWLFAQFRVLHDEDVRDAHRLQDELKELLREDGD